MAALVDLSQKIDHGIKFDDIRNRIVITEDLMRDLRISGVPQERTPREPSPPIDTSRAPAAANAWHRRSHATSAAVLYRQSRRHMSSRATFPPGKPIYRPTKNSRELPLFPELSANQCQLFAKHKYRNERGTGRRRPRTEPSYNTQCYQHILGDEEVRRFQQEQHDLRREAAGTPTKSTTDIKLPEIQTPTPSVREKYIVKWLYGDPNGRSPYITPKDMRFRLSKKKGTPMENLINKKLNNTPVTPFANEMKSSLS
ncbi:uncharacterized protein LOC110978888 [Acanthaster planci]|uniref:Uncharacterized protein LOC110978888 n=1 Tax=Acanthaster planci TaxID=133434 RepID=A0A8B7YBH8_ACAPL|nr:uncharacterized protein LOC110978888 [Acanthaster planci]